MSVAAEVSAGRGIGVQTEPAWQPARAAFAAPLVCRNMQPPCHSPLAALCFSCPAGLSRPPPCLPSTPGYPTIKWFGENKDSPEDYEGGRDAGSLASFATSRWSAQQPPPEVRGSGRVVI